MGEYITLDGQAVKLGTMESLYYVRFADLVGDVDLTGKGVEA